MIQRTDREGY